jgi:hypothetical protein
VARSVLRVVLDSNVFSDCHFPVLAESRFLELVRRGRVVPVFPAIVLEETVRSYCGEVTRSLLLTQWIPYIVATRARFCDEMPAIWARELLQGRGPKASEHMDSRMQANVVRTLQLLAPDGSSPLVADALPMWAESNARLRRRRETSKRMRERAARLARSRRLKLKPDLHVEEMTQDEVRRELALALIGKGIAHGNQALELLHRWQRNPTDFPYFNQAIENELYQLLLPQRDHSVRIDVNAQPDLDVLTHLLRADALVTNETAFMPRAFDDIWKPRGKVRFNTEAFVALLEKL